MDTMSIMMPTFIIIGASFVVSIVIIIFVRKALGPDKKLLQTGETAYATVLRIWETGVTVNDNPRVGLLLEVRPNNRAPFQAEVKKVVSIVQIPQFQPGATVEVKFDPANPQKVAITGIVSGASLGGSPMMGMMNPQAQMQAQQYQMQEMLLKIDSNNKTVLATGEEAPAVILNTWDMGMRVNGNNPVMGFQLEVRPSNRPPFQAEAQGPVMETSLPKYQPGAMIYVKYDRNDPRRVVIAHA